MDMIVFDEIGERRIFNPSTAWSKQTYSIEIFLMGSI